MFSIRYSPETLHTTPQDRDATIFICLTQVYLCDCGRFIVSIESPCLERFGDCEKFIKKSAIVLFFLPKTKKQRLCLCFVLGEILIYFLLRLLRPSISSDIPSRIVIVPCFAIC